MAGELKQPCAACPWRKSSAAGWLGASTPVEFLQQSEDEIRMPCHLHVDYDREDWHEQADKAPQCAGRAVHFANRCKRPRNPELVTLPADRDEVFSNPQEFIDHHSHGKGPQIMLVMGEVVPLP
ncbi:hypothetical protein [Stutzerimonas nitrititolerans]|uniref:hypothetical protein n=1 Tax=Stutzerimonas nitrititolerans TaxID=2482751 RepID=UPI0028A7C50A|nr:hypothetical protein [Stutzerimonas nitrititolerans]